MFVNEEDDDNQYMGLVARGRSSYASQIDSTPTPSLPASALEKRTSSIVSFPPRTSSSSFQSESHDPYADAQPVNITPLLLKKMERIILIAAYASNANRVNRYQASLASRRMKLISTVLRQMPHPAPSPRLLTAMQSLCLLVRQCAYDVADEDTEDIQSILYGPDEDPFGPAQRWPVLLCQHFTCRLLFRNAYRRLWTAWRMYSPVELEREDALAEAKDRNVNTDVMLQLLVASSARDSCGNEVDVSPATVEQHKKDMLAFYQRREMNPWRVLYQQLAPTTQLVRGTITQPPNSSERAPSFSSPAAAENDFRFRVLPTVYAYNGVPVVVKAFCAAATTISFDDCDAATAAAAMQHAPDFLQDVACRCMWCHPHVVGCLGAYTEKFVPAASKDSQNRDALSQAATKDAAGVPDRTPQCPVQRGAPAASAQPPVPALHLPWLHPVDTLSGAPVLALGYVTELQTSADATTPCATLGDILFPASPTSAATTTRHYFSLSEALDICAQLADALQYILEDSGDVPVAVRTSWLTLDPFNVYVVRTVGTNTPAGKPDLQQRLQLSREGTMASVGDGGAAAAVRNGSNVFSASVSLLGATNNSASSVSINSNHNSSVVLVPRQTGREHSPLLHPASQLSAFVDPSQLLAASSAREGKGAPNAADIALATIAAPPHRGPHRLVVRYCPPSDWTKRAVGSRWRPHPRATAPASYVVAQMLLALMTRQVPYAAYQSDSDVQRRVFDIAAGPTNGGLSDAEAAAAGVRVKLSSSGQGYSLPSSLPAFLVQLCRLALSLDKSQPPMELESLRDALTTIQASLPEAVVGSSPTVLQDTPRSFSHGAPSRELSGQFDSGFG
ncbi:hypothetical protein ABB37_05364 [Leptomonas pyrrhocoris]|uniref:Uncharacterized protein n=1 Tax=Leptomonas pyrrhocoris TaxID=157538 RepID=A0A0M9G0A9_LEPPY|nr:hypothetical protein ABB37_05364 [Leptomonas pyrrhocoris]KPA79546.1 hypothetical protein ABB37_05364 [Leptomonas pyrrhocoris]|eukprot:XP_015657985.1 hypothetical protein ABB37_05364 [Leptomonas pyrrhocoris]